MLYRAMIVGLICSATALLIGTAYGSLLLALVIPYVLICLTIWVMDDLNRKGEE
jgi:hypothetical protein